MNDNVAENYVISIGRRRRELGFDIGVEGDADHGVVDDPGCGEAMAAQDGDEVLHALKARRARLPTTFAPSFSGRPPGCLKTNHRGIHRSVVDKDETTSLLALPRLTRPCPKRFNRYVLPVLDARNYVCRRFICPPWRLFLSTHRDGIDIRKTAYEPFFVRGLRPSPSDLASLDREAAYAGATMG